MNEARQWVHGAMTSNTMKSCMKSYEIITSTNDITDITLQNPVFKDNIITSNMGDVTWSFLLKTASIHWEVGEATFWKDQ